MLNRIVFILIVLISCSSFASKKMMWVAIGDSITYLNEHQNETGNRITKGYMTRVVNKLSFIEYINQGHNGWTSGGIADKIETLGLVKAEVYSIFLGTNDWWAGRPIGQLSDYIENTGNSTVYGSFRIIINKLRNLNPEAKIILLTPMQRVDFIYLTDMTNNAFGSYREKNGQSLSSFAEAIIEISKYEKYSLVDLYNHKKLKLEHMVKFKRLKDPQTRIYKKYNYPAFIEIPFNPMTDEYPYPVKSIAMTYDGLHPSDAGYKVIAEELIKVMKEFN